MRSLGRSPGTLSSRSPRKEDNLWGHLECLIQSSRVLLENSPHTLITISKTKKKQKKSKRKEKVSRKVKGNLFHRVFDIFFGAAFDYKVLDTIDELQVGWLRQGKRRLHLSMGERGGGGGGEEKKRERKADTALLEVFWKKSNSTWRCRGFSLSGINWNVSVQNNRDFFYRESQVNVELLTASVAQKSDIRILFSDKAVPFLPTSCRCRARSGSRLRSRSRSRSRSREASSGTFLSLEGDLLFIEL